MDYHGIEYILSPPKSPDMSIIETWVSSICRKFYYKHYATECEGVERFYDIWGDGARLFPTFPIDRETGLCFTALLVVATAQYPVSNRSRM